MFVEAMLIGSLLTTVPNFKVTYMMYVCVWLQVCMIVHVDLCLYVYWCMCVCGMCVKYACNVAYKLCLYTCVYVFMYLCICV